MFAAINQFLTGTAAGYFINKSLRFRSSASAYLNRTPATATNQKTWTWSGWVKRGTLGATQNLATVANTGSSLYFYLRFLSTDVLEVFTYNSAGSSFVWQLQTTQVFRDPAAWYHIVIATDTTQGTAANRVKIYVNGSQITSFAVASYPSASYDTVYNYNGASYINSYLGASSFYDGETAELNSVDGQALAPTSFGAFSTYNQWLPIRYAGTYGTNGFYLPFNSVSTSSYAASFSNTTQCAQVADNTVLAFGTNPFTIEMWVYPTASLSNAPYIFAKMNSALNTNPGLGWYINLYPNAIYWGASTAALGYATHTTTTTLNAWTHLAFTRVGSSLTCYVNGVSVGTQTVTLAAANNDNSYPLQLGNWTAYTSTYFTGYMSNVRVVKGTAVYTANFVPPTAPLTAISGTSLLTLQSSTLVDNSGNSLAITNQGTVVSSVQYPFSVFAFSDSSGNANNWTPNNISLTAGSTYDSLTDVPTLTSTTVANYAVLNAVNPKGNSTVSNGNLTEVITTVTGAGRGTTIAVTSGKFYVEATAVGGGAMVTSVGITSPSASTYQVYLAGVGYYSNNGNKYVSGVGSAYGTAWASAGTYTIGMALDVGAGTIQFYLNNVAQGNITLPTMPSDGWIFVADWESSAGSVTYNWNYGQQPFVYTAPTGFLPLNTYNI